MAHPALAVDNYLPYMPDVVRCETSLRELNVMWRLIESTARMVCPTEAQAILPTIAATRSGFDRLESELVRSLVTEKIDNVMSAIATRAGYIIDIVVRNLYERTADVGFLAIDRVLCEFVAGHVRDVDAVRARLRSYRRKYTVYDEIFLLDTEGNVLVQTDPAYAVESLRRQQPATDRPPDTCPRGTGADRRVGQRPPVHGDARLRASTPSMPRSAARSCAPTSGRSANGSGGLVPATMACRRSRTPSSAWGWL
ncbi:hypothetical protein Taqua_00295 [Tepidimonas aquatica]|uniref:Uncharacterized protein n=1 Tax=Tepidimonas aquatica TaxID=247482 RepID=A0A554WVG7_9BURK|nr:hypothetical protein Taqua_00295 [Tepidimonas aquatica]